MSQFSRQVQKNFLVDRKGTVTPRPDFRDHDLLVSTILEELKK